MRQSGSGKEALSPSGRNLRWEDKSNVNRSVPRKDFTLLFGVLFVSLLVWFVFDVDHFFKVLLNLLQYCFFYGFSVWVFFCLFFCVCFFCLRACGVLAPGPGIKPALPALESKVFSTGPPGKSPHSGFC